MDDIVQSITTAANNGIKEKEDSCNKKLESELKLQKNRFEIERQRLQTKVDYLSREDLNYPRNAPIEVYLSS